MDAAHVLDADGRTLAPCPADKARRLVAEGRAELLSEGPLAIRLMRAVPLPAPRPAPADPWQGARVLLHACCGPCTSWTAPYLASRGAQVTGYWYNPNIHPFSEHERRREALDSLAAQTGLEMLWQPGYDLTAFLRAVAGHEAPGERCRLCYRLRLERAAQAAAHGGFDAFATTLLISPYQDLEAIRALGAELTAEYGVRFIYENLRRGYAASRSLADEYGLYLQRYCGCIYSEWEALDPTRRQHGAGVEATG